MGKRLNDPTNGNQLSNIVPKRKIKASDLTPEVKPKIFSIIAVNGEYATTILLELENSKVFLPHLLNEVFTDELINECKSRRAACSAF